ncbi:MAG: hypothetical protein CM15mP60_1520 [Alphaproteobacteria bacterium]|nr:MAG: hypothetical protein CM15mP60_1520 [Alphaproteobacteria bacterium]
MTDFTVSSTDAAASFKAAITLEQIEDASAANHTSIDSSASSTNLTTTILAESSIDWVDEKDPPVKVGYDAVNHVLV